MGEEGDNTPQGAFSRRRLLAGFAGGGLTLTGGVAVNNVVLGYGTISGTNLLEQDLDSLAAAGFRVFPFTLRVDSTEIQYAHDELVVRDTDSSTVERLQIEPGVQARAKAIDDTYQLHSVLEELATDIVAISTGDLSFEFHSVTDFFETLAAAETRGFSTQAVRGLPSADPSLVEGFTGTSPSDTEETITGLVGGFREHTHYDFPRYVAGSIQDNILFGARDLRAPFETKTDYETMLGDQSIGLFCYDFTDRSIEALHAVPAFEQSVPVVGARVRDARHKHVYTGIGSLYRENGDLRVGMTFVDYTHTTMYDDLHVRAILGDGLNAYNPRHRATLIQWIRY